MIVEKLYVGASDITDVAVLKEGDKIVLKKHRIESGVYTATSTRADDVIRVQGFLEVVTDYGGSDYVDYKGIDGDTYYINAADVEDNFLLVRAYEDLPRFEGVAEGTKMVLGYSEELKALEPVLDVLESTGAHLKDYMRKILEDPTKVFNVVLEDRGSSLVGLRFEDGNNYTSASKAYGHLFIKAVPKPEEVKLRYKFVPRTEEWASLVILEQSEHFYAIGAEGIAIEGGVDIDSVRSITNLDVADTTLYLKGTHDSRSAGSSTLVQLTRMADVHHALQETIKEVRRRAGFKVEPSPVEFEVEYS